MGRFVVRTRERTGSGAPQFLVLDSEDQDRPVAEFDDEEAARAHAARLDEGPFDWDEQEAWQDAWDEDRDDGREDGRGDA